MRPLRLAVAASLLLAACAPSNVPVTHPKATPAAPATLATTAGILGKMKEPVGLARQVATITSLHDLLPVAKASHGMGSLRAASSLLSDNGGSLLANNGAGLIGNNGGNWQLLQAMSLLPDYVKVRQDAVLHQQPDGLLSATISLYDVKQYDPHPGADNEPALIDRFHMEVAAVNPISATELSFDLDLKVVSSKRIPFIDKLTLRETGHTSEQGGFVPTKMEYLLGFAVPLLDGAKDQADLRLVANAADLVPAVGDDGKSGASFEARRMDVLGSNGHGDYAGEATFLAGGDIACTCTHTRTEGAVTKANLSLHPDGSSEESAESVAGQLRFEAKTSTAGQITVQVRDLALADAPVIPVDVTVADGVATFDLKNGQTGRARID